MDRKTYIDTVLSTLRRVTGRERSAIREEIDGHIEDHMEGLIELGYDPALAEERTLAAMGDPKEVGWELNKQYTGWGWVLLGRAAKVGTVLLLLPVCLGLLLDGGWLRCIEGRFHPPEMDVWGLSQVESTLDVEIRQQVGDDELWVYKVLLGRGYDEQTDTWQDLAAIQAVAYDRIPFGIVASWLLDGMTLTDQRGQKEGWCGIPTQYDSRLVYLEGTVEVQPGDTYVTLHCDRYGQEFSIDIPLPEEGTA